MQNTYDEELLEFLKDVNENILDEYKNDIQNTSIKQEKSETQINTEQDE